MNCRNFSCFKPTLGQCWIIALVFIVGNVFMSMLFTVLGLNDLLINYTSISYIVTVFVPFLYIFIVSRRNCNLGLEKPVPIDNPDFGKVNKWLFFAILLFCPILMTVIIDPLNAAMPMPDVFKQLFEQIFSGTPLWDTILATSIMAPICEEFLCRGIMLRGMLENNVKPWKAIFWSALIFAVIHLNPWQGLAAFSLALFFGWIYYRTRSLWAVIFLHFVNNFSSILLSRLFPEVEVDAALCKILPTFGFVALFVGCAALLIAIISYLNKNLKKNEKESEEIISA